MYYLRRFGETESAIRVIPTEVVVRHLEVLCDKIQTAPGESSKIRCSKCSCALLLD